MQAMSAKDSDPPFPKREKTDGRFDGSRPGPGRPKGSANGQVVEFRAWLRDFFEGKDIRDAMLTRMGAELNAYDQDGAPAGNLTLTRHMLDQTYGKAKQQVEVSGLAEDIRSTIELIYSKRDEIREARMRAIMEAGAIDGEVIKRG